MKTLLILATSFFLLGCDKTSLPDFPDIKDHYLVQVSGGQVYCVKCEILSKIPYKIGNCVEVETVSCDLVGGFKPADTVKLNNWLVDVKKWSEQKAQCLKK